jgi:hypothetical protein
MAMQRHSSSRISTLTTVTLIRPRRVLRPTPPQLAPFGNVFCVSKRTSLARRRVLASAQRVMGLSVLRLQRTHGLLLDQALKDMAEQIRKIAANGLSIYNNEAGMMDVMDHAVIDMSWTVPLGAQRNSGTAGSYTTLEEYVSSLCSISTSLAANNPAFLLAPPPPCFRPQPVMLTADETCEEYSDFWDDSGAYEQDDAHLIRCGESQYSPRYSRRGRGSRSRDGLRGIGFAGRRGGSSSRPPYVPPRPFVPGPPGSCYDCGRPGHQAGSPSCPKQVAVGSAMQSPFGRDFAAQSRPPPSRSCIFLSELNAAQDDDAYDAIASELQYSLDADARAGILARRANVAGPTGPAHDTAPAHGVGLSEQPPEDRAAAANAIGDYWRRQANDVPGLGFRQPRNC